jgi:hypothetical protein
MSFSTLVDKDVLRIASFVLKAGSLFTCCGAGLVLFGVAWASRYPEIQHEGNWSTNTSATLAVTVGTAFWIFGGSHDRLLGRLISVRPLTLIGDCSYSIYLLHWPIWVLLITSLKQTNNVIALAFAMSIGLGWLQFRFVEEPIRSRSKLPSTKTLEFVGVFGLVAVVGYAAMSYATPIIAMHLAGIKPDEISLHIIEKPCLGERFVLGNAQSCQFSTAINQGVAILVGDSMAKSLSDGFVSAANAEALNAYVFSLPGCSFLAFDSPFSPTLECIGWRQNVFAALSQLQPKLVMIANMNTLYTHLPLADFTLEKTRDAWGYELTRTFDALAPLQAKVMLVQPPPSFEYDLRYDISLLRKNGVQEDRAIVIARRAPINEVEVNTAALYPFLAPVLNFDDLFCNAETCTQKIGKQFMLEDADHLSVEGSMLAAPLVQNAIALMLVK